MSIFLFTAFTDDVLRLPDIANINDTSITPIDQKRAGLIAKIKEFRAKYAILPEDSGTSAFVFSSVVNKKTKTTFKSNFSASLYSEIKKFSGDEQNLLILTPTVDNFMETDPMRNLLMERMLILMKIIYEIVHKKTENFICNQLILEKNASPDVLYYINTLLIKMFQDIKEEGPSSEEYNYVLAEKTKRRIEIVLCNPNNFLFEQLPLMYQKNREELIKSDLFEGWKIYLPIKNNDEPKYGECISEYRNIFGSIYTPLGIEDRFYNEAIKCCGGILEKEITTKNPKKCFNQLAPFFLGGKKESNLFKMLPRYPEQKQELVLNIVKNILTRDENFSV
jgi:hypothetical protein